MAVAPGNLPGAVIGTQVAPGELKPGAAEAVVEKAVEATPALAVESPSAAVSAPTPASATEPDVLTVVVSGAGGQIGYSVLPLICGGNPPPLALRSSTFFFSVRFSRHLLRLLQPRFVQRGHACSPHESATDRAIQQQHIQLTSKCV